MNYLQEVQNERIYGFRIDTDSNGVPYYLSFVTMHMCRPFIESLANGGEAITGYLELDFTYFDDVNDFMELCPNSSNDSDSFEWISFSGN